MNYLVIELQSNGGTVSNIVTTHATRNEAESKYHAVLSAAAVSNVDAHSAVLLDEQGGFISAQCYEHGE